MSQPFSIRMQRPLSKVAVGAESMFENLFRRPGNFSKRAMKQLRPGDSMFDYLPALPDKAIEWGKQ